ncbi:sugar phosphate isomerase/epimerase family protein [uncultured Jatrophihabitans sp.]|uniref:sugar phosphate isomerase/epimerase family protein n=1 Tax=uncultured Jatrophihabitans sp. TaxID=1610747 RepID=UPI0035CC18A6
MNPPSATPSVRRSRLPVGLAPLTLHRPGDPFALIDAAARAGFAAVGMTPRTPDGAWASWCRQPTLTAVASAAANSGLAVTDVGVATLDTPQDTDAVHRLTEVAAALGAGVLIVLDRDHDARRAHDSLAAITESAARSGVTAGLEFMAYSAAPDVSKARRLTAGTAAGIVFDVFQHERAGGSPADLDEDDPLVLVQLADGVPMSDVDLRTEALTDRRLPGHGTFDLPAYLARVPAGVPITVEAPCLALAQLPWHEQARAAAQATSELLDRLLPEA